MTDMIYTLSSLEETQDWGAFIAQRLQPQDILLLKGELGAGKTTLARAIITSLNPAVESVPSPTFTLVQTYETMKGVLWHYDLYRLKQPEDSFELGLEEAFATGITLIEWPEHLGNLKLPPFLEISFQFVQNILENSDTEQDYPRKIMLDGPLVSRSIEDRKRWQR